MSGVARVVRFALASPRPFTTRDASRAGELNYTTTGHVCSALAAAGLVEDLGRAGWRTIKDGNRHE